MCTAIAEAFAVGQRAGVDLDKLVELVSAGLVNSGIFQVMAKTLKGDLGGMKFELNNARKDVRYYTHLAENLGAPSVVGEAVHQSLVLACALGYGEQVRALAGRGAGAADRREAGAALKPSDCPDFGHSPQVQTAVMCPDRGQGQLRLEQCSGPPGPPNAPKS